MEKLKNNSTDILQKKGYLEQVKTQLKQEFFGIDQIIDSIFVSISSWYLFPEIQNKPTIINLWGLTGVGKSSLVHRIAELLNYENKYYRFDMGALNENNHQIKGKLEDLYDNESGYPIIIGFDEFQYAKNINEEKKEVQSVHTRVVWDILDSGVFYVNKDFRYVEKLYELRDKIQYLLLSGVKVESGEIIEGHKKVIDLLRIKWRVHFDNGVKRYDTDGLSLIEDDNYFPIYQVRKDLFKNEYQISDYLKKLDGPQMITFLEESIEFALSSKPVDCTKALIFVMGNLDEAFWMSGDFNPDLSADEFHDQSLKINISHIKQALSKRFRSEQIARLGNTHFIYPSFSSKTYNQIIEHELIKQGYKFNEFINAKIVFHQSIVDLIYKEGVFPTQGTRPLFTTIHQLIDSLLAKIYYEIKLHAKETDYISFCAVDSKIIIEFRANGELIKSITEKVELNLGKLRQNRNDDLQAITAVHEAGHVVLSMSLLNSLPECAYSVTADSESQGFIYTKMKWKYVSKKQIKNRLAVMLGGFIAEKIIFGEENVTNGAESDLYKATCFATNMIKNSGMGSVLGTIHVKSSVTNQYIHDENLNLNNEVLKLISEAQVLAEESLNSEKKLLMEISTYLTENPMMNKAMLKEFMLKHALSINIEKVLNENPDEFYKTLLKQKSDSLRGEKKQLALPYYTLNQNRNESEIK